MVDEQLAGSLKCRVRTEKIVARGNSVTDAASLGSLGRLLASAIICLLGVIAPARPASAHGGPGSDDAQATNYRTRILSVAPEVDGLEIRVVEGGDRLELVNNTESPVIVLGYEGEPYLRVGSDGVFVNKLSPATSLNADRAGTDGAPLDADPDAEPAWERVGDGPMVRWHDHRAHWMGSTAPPAVEEDPGQVQGVIPEWSVRVLVGGPEEATEVTVTGDLTWVPGPSPWPWYLVTLATVVLLGCASCISSVRTVLRLSVVALAAAAAADIVGVWSQSSASVMARLPGMTTPVLCLAMLLAGAITLDRAPREASAITAAGACGAALVFGVSSMDWLHRSQLPTSLHPTLARVAVAASLGIGFGIALLVAIRLLARPDEPA